MILDSEEMMKLYNVTQNNPIEIWLFKRYKLIFLLNITAEYAIFMENEITLLQYRLVKYSKVCHFVWQSLLNLEHQTYFF